MRAISLAWSLRWWAMILLTEAIWSKGVSFAFVNPTSILNEKREGFFQ